MRHQLDTEKLLVELGELEAKLGAPPHTAIDAVDSEVEPKMSVHAAARAGQVAEVVRLLCERGVLRSRRERTLLNSFLGRPSRLTAV